MGGPPTPGIAFASRVLSFTCQHLSLNVAGLWSFLASGLRLWPCGGQTSLHSGWGYGTASQALGPVELFEDHCQAALRLREFPGQDAPPTWLSRWTKSPVATVLEHSRDGFSRPGSLCCLIHAAAPVRTGQIPAAEPRSPCCYTEQDQARPCMRGCLCLLGAAFSHWRGQGLVGGVSGRRRIPGTGCVVGSPCFPPSEGGALRVQCLWGRGRPPPPLCPGVTQ